MKKGCMSVKRLRVNFGTNSQVTMQFMFTFDLKVALNHSAFQQVSYV